ncbi:MAG: hypothetical protein HY784_17075 [Chloroflexi bacterium]|nr:hypothetical protein [Chloroflexota bacterium]
MADIQQLLVLIAQGLLVLAIPIVIAYLGLWLRQRAQELHSRLTVQQQQLVDTVISSVVRAAQQQGIVGELKTGGAKREYALKMASGFLARYGITGLDLSKLAALVEAEVNKQFSSAAVPPDTAEARQQLLDRAVQVAVDAAQQSGVTGLIQNIGEQKKGYAIQFASRYLAEHGIRVPEDVLQGLIEAQIMQLKRERAAAMR